MKNYKEEIKTLENSLFYAPPNAKSALKKRIAALKLRQYFFDFVGFGARFFSFLCLFSGIMIVVVSFSEKSLSFWCFLLLGLACMYSSYKLRKLINKKL